MHTRSLPKSLETISLSHNKIFGHIDLTTLPHPLEEAYFMFNKLTGPILLTRLPRYLRFLNVLGNDIRQHTVWYDDLPESLVTVSLVKSRDQSKIKEVRAVNGIHSVKGKEIFAKIEEENVY